MALDSAELISDFFLPSILATSFMVSSYVITLDLLSPEKSMSARETNILNGKESSSIPHDLISVIINSLGVIFCFLLAIRHLNI